MEDSIKNAVDDFNSRVKDSEKIIIGVKAHKAESKEQLKERLKSIADYSCDYFLSTGAMCYSPMMPEEIILKHTCPTCGRIYQYAVWGYREGKIIQGEHSQLQKNITDVVNKIKQLGYDIQVEHMCGFCYLKKYGKVPVHIDYLGDYEYDEYEEEELEDEEEIDDEYLDTNNAKEHILESNDSVSVLAFRFSSNDEYTRNIVSLEDCKVLLEFLNGNNAYVDDRDEINMLTSCSDLIKNLLGI